MPILDTRIELTLSNDVDLIYKAVENRHLRERLTGGAHWLASLLVGQVDPTWRRLAICHGGLPPGLFRSIPKLVLSRISVI